jgi:enoyl-CoA hydratase/carnithine racemase
MNLILEELPGAHGARIGLATLDSPQNLNALSLPMIKALDARLREWAQDPAITCVLLRGNGPKGFCAGGDVRRLVEVQREHPGEVHELARQFFASEYRLDHLIHSYPKPLLCWAHGHVLGGGMGLLQGASVRIVTPDSLLAMPEISIGLYPDAGGSWFLGRLPKPLGLFFGLTGSQINAADALDLGLADRLLLPSQQQALIDGLLQLNWQLHPQRQLHSLLQALSSQARSELPASQWPQRRERLEQLLDVADLASAWHALVGLGDDADPLLAKAARTLQAGCPLTAQLVWEQLQRSRHLSLADTFRLEYAISLNCCRHADFIEGVRARLIDKDGAPHWHWPQLEQVPPAVLEAHFEPTWSGPHPLADL